MLDQIKFDHTSIKVDGDTEGKEYRSKMATAMITILHASSMAAFAFEFNML